MISGMLKITILTYYSKMKNRAIVITLALLTISVANFFQFFNHGNIRTVEFVSILAMGILLGILIVLLVKKKP